MADPRIKKQLINLLAAAGKLAVESKASGVLVLSADSLDWKAVREYFPGGVRLLIACPKQSLPDVSHFTDGDRYELHGIEWVQLEETDLPIWEQISAALLEAVAEETLRPGDTVITLYSAFSEGEINSLSIIHLEEHLERFTSADLKQLESYVPLETLRLVIELALEIAREGREGKPVGTMFIVGDVRNVKKYCRPMGLDPFKRVPKEQRKLRSHRIREEIKELAQLDGAFIIDEKGYIEASRQWVGTPTINVTLSKGLGARHWAAAAISAVTRAVVVVVSESSGTVRIFQNGEVKLRLEPARRRALKWQEFEPAIEKPVRPEVRLGRTIETRRPEGQS